MIRIKASITFISILLLFGTADNAHAQFWKKRNKGTSRREIRKRQEQANKKSDYNKFNELIPMGSSISTARTDYLWSYETANTIPVGSADLSLGTPSRISIKKGSEFGTSIASLPFIPMIYYKKRWLNDKLLIATRHQAYSYSPGLYILRNMNNYDGIEEEYEIPDVIAVKNELIISKPFLKELKCGNIKQPYIIISAALAYDYGYAIKSTELEVIDHKFARTRSGVILGSGGFTTVRLQGDFYLNQNLFLTIAARGLFARNTYGNSLEHNAMLRYKFAPKFTLSAGYWMNFGQGDGSFILPLVDISYHLGNNGSRDKGLFK